MRITTWNVNGLRAAIRKGFGRHVETISPDVLMLQEIRVTPDLLPPEFGCPDGWQVIWNPAKRPGYSGTAIWSRVPLQLVETGFGPRDTDDEGRLIEVLLETAAVRQIQLACVYLPSGSSGAHRQVVKDAFLRKFSGWAKSRTGSTPVVFGGDLNVAPTAADLFYARANEQTSGFLPHERAWFSRLIKSGWHDLIREHHGAMQGPYSWWSNRGRARELDRGWRIDHLLCNQAARPLVRAAIVHREGGLEVSDHAPVSIDLEF
jgi:exodeoxyribonuclease III